MANKELTNNIHSHNIITNECKDSIICEKEKSSKKHLIKDENSDKVEIVEVDTQIKIDINDNKNNLFLTRDHANNNYKHYKNNKKKHKEKYIESSIRNNENNTDAKANVVNNILTYQTNTKQINLDNDKIEQDFGENKNYLNNQHYNIINNNHHIHNDNNQSLSKPRSLTVLETGLLKNANNKYSPEVINRILIDIGNNLNHVVDVEKSSCSSGSINKDTRYKLNKKQIPVLTERKER